MNIRTINSIGILLISCAVMIACKKPAPVTIPTNYWKSNTLTQLQLKGKVKKISTPDGGYKEFDINGNIIKSVDIIGNETRTIISQYDSKQRLVTSIETSNQTTEVETKTFFYTNIGKYVALNSVVPSLGYEMSKETCPHGSSIYSFSGNNMQGIITDTGLTDTISAVYNGSYPTSMKLLGNKNVTNIVYGNNGLFKSYTITTTFPITKQEDKYYFAADDKYLRVDSIISKNISSLGTLPIDESRFRYNDQKDLVYSYIRSDGYYSEFTYTYDSNNNWTSKTTVMKTTNNGTTSKPSTETRTIEYWN